MNLHSRLERYPLLSWPNLLPCYLVLPSYCSWYLQRRHCCQRRPSRRMEHSISWCWRRGCHFWAYLESEYRINIAWCLAYFSQKQGVRRENGSFLQGINLLAVLWWEIPKGRTSIIRKRFFYRSLVTKDLKAKSFWVCNPFDSKKRQWTVERSESATSRLFNQAKSVVYRIGRGHYDGCIT